VEALRPGDQLLALAGKARVKMPIVWIGRRHIDLARHSEPGLVQPIRIRRDAIRPGCPARDLLVSPDHAIFVDDGLIPAKLLVNGGSIVQQRARNSVTYYHVELAEHAIILAEGLPVESYLDTGNRGAFENGGGPVMLHPAFCCATRENSGCAPFVVAPAQVWPVWQLLAQRAAAIGWPVAFPEASHEPALMLRFGRHLLRPVSASGDRYVFVLPGDAWEVHLVSRSAVPSETRPWVDDRRRLGVRIGRITVQDEAELTEVALDSPALGKGWWAVETEGLGATRWTDGAAQLHLPPGAGSGRVLILRLAGFTSYPSASTHEPQPLQKAA
jgi:Hint domain